MNRRLALLVIVIFLVFNVFVRVPFPEILLPAEPVLPLGQVGPFRFVVTNTMLATWLAMVLLIGLSFLATRRMELIPSGRLQNLAEALVEWMYGIVESVAGEQRWARQFFPVVATIFLFIITANWMGLLPGYTTVGLIEAAEHGKVCEFVPIHISPVEVGVLPVFGAVCRDIPAGEHAEEAHAEARAGVLEGKLIPLLRSANTDVNTPLAIALVAMLFVEYWGIKALGPVGYGSRFFNFQNLLRGRIFMGVIDVFIGLLELIAEVARVISFTFRLFGNIFAGEVLLASIAFLAPLVIALPFYGLELFVGFIQAAVFAMLTLVFAKLAVTPHHGEEHHGH
jgi:F-type H+-transporting ATPase subunit a